MASCRIWRPVPRATWAGNGSGQAALPSKGSRRLRRARCPIRHRVLQGQRMRLGADPTALEAAPPEGGRPRPRVCIRRTPADVVAPCRALGARHNMGHTQGRSVQLRPWTARWSMRPGSSLAVLLPRPHCSPRRREGRLRLGRPEAAAPAQHWRRTWACIHRCRHLAWRKLLRTSSPVPVSDLALPMMASWSSTRIPLRRRQIPRSRRAWARSSPMAVHRC
mmetsp:Transcript_40207/g.87895  ORF Transcript_40207/g.87895 Transcript_40207/m.87895 type:complete len:221 (-) Transcript_40207:2989-3651(-)